MSVKRCLDEETDECKEHVDKHVKIVDDEKVSDEKIATPEEEKKSVKPRRTWDMCKHPNCQTRASFGVKGTRHVLFCRLHRDALHVDVSSRKCTASGCDKYPCFNVKGSKKALFCRDHRRPEMVDVINKRCIRDGCDNFASCNFKGSKVRLYCREHMLPGMSDLVAQKCAAVDCNTQPSFNFEGSKERLFCAAHAKSGMVDVTKARCAEMDCKTIPCFNIEGSGKPLYCMDHAKTGMVNVLGARCIAIGCKKHPSFNVEGSKKGIHCRDHAVSGEINVTTKRCAADGCSKISRFNVPGSDPLFCRDHAEQSMINIVDRMCEAKDCKKHASYHIAGSKVPVYCSVHAKPLMVDISAIRCAASGCNTGAWYGLPGTKATHCAQHKENGQVSHPRRSCEHDKCRRPATFGIRKPERCDDHKTAVDRDFVLKRCVVCDQPAITFPDDQCCDLCTKRTHNVRLKRQLEIQAMLRECKDEVLSKYTSYDKPVTNCSRYRPDFMWDSKTHMVILEVDEHQHKDYPEECELARMKNLTQDIHMPCVFVRYNPDSYEGQPASLRDKKRQDHLCKVLKHCITLPPIENPDETLRVTRLFFDGYKYPEPCVLTNLSVE